MAGFYLRMIPLGLLGANCYILSSDGEGVVIDPGGDEKMVIDLILREGLRLCYVINTHGHYDHIGGNNRVLDACGGRLAIHRLDSKLLEDPIENLSAGLGFPYRSRKQDLLLEDGDELPFGSHLLRVIHTPGHTPGGISLLIPDQDLVFSGDTLFAGSVGRTDFPGCDWKTLLQSIRERLLPLGDEVRVLPGHGEETTIGCERRKNPFLIN